MSYDNDHRRKVHFSNGLCSVNACEEESKSDITADEDL